MNNIKPSLLALLVLMLPFTTLANTWDKFQDKDGKEFVSYTGVYQPGELASKQDPKLATEQITLFIGCTNKHGTKVFNTGSVAMYTSTLGVVPIYHYHQDYKGVPITKGGLYISEKSVPLTKPETLEANLTNVKSFYKFLEDNKGKVIYFQDGPIGYKGHPGWILLPKESIPCNKF